MLRVWMFIAAVAFPAASALAQADAGAAPMAVDDALFAAAAAESGASEVAMGRVGLEKATDPELKRISRHLIDDHTKANEELTRVAAAKAYALPREVGPCPKFKLGALAGLSGREFDRCFAKAQRVAHEDTIEIFEAEAERGRDPDLKALAAKTLPKLREHLDMIKPIAEKLEHSGRANPAATP